MNISSLKNSIKNMKTLPFFIGIAGGWNLSTISLLITKSVPGSVNNTKEINFSDIQIPGGHTSNTRFGSFGPTNVSFSLKIADFNDTLGITATTSMLEHLRRPTSSTNLEFDEGSRIFKPFTPPPKILLFHSMIYSVPLLYTVRKCDFETSIPNKYGKPQVVNVSFQLTVYEDENLYKTEVVAAQALALINTAKSFKKTFSTGNPYKKRKNSLLGII